MSTVAHLALGTGVILTLCLALALAALDLHLFSQVRLDVPAALPALIIGLLLAAGSFLFLGWRLRRGRQVRLAAYQATLGLVILSVAILARQVVRFFGADSPVPGSILLGMNGLTLCTMGLLLAPSTRRTLVAREELEPGEEDLRAEVDLLVAEIQETYRKLPPPVAPPLTTLSLLREAVLRPVRAFQELRVHPHLELCWIIPLLVLAWPRLTVFAGSDERLGTLMLAGLDYGLWVALYDAGKAAMFWGIARARGAPLRYASALAAVMIIDLPSLAVYLVDHLWPGQYVWTGAGWYSNLGFAPFIAGLLTAHPAIFDALAKADLHHMWTFVLWWVALGVLGGMRKRVALIVSLVTFPGAHVFAWAARLFVQLVGGPRA